MHKWNPELSMAKPPQLYGPHVPVIVLKTSDYYTQEPNNSVSLSGVLEEPKSSTFYNSYRINMELPQNTTFGTKITYIRVRKNYNTSLLNMFK